MLDQFNFANHVEKATHLGKMSIDHIVSNISHRVQHPDFIPCETISDNDSPYILTNIKGETFQHRYKFIRNYKKYEYIYERF